MSHIPPITIESVSLGKSFYCKLLSSCSISLWWFPSPPISHLFKSTLPRLEETYISQCTYTLPLTSLCYPLLQIHCASELHTTRTTATHYFFEPSFIQTARILKAYELIHTRPQHSSSANKSNPTSHKSFDLLICTNLWTHRIFHHNSNMLNKE